MKNKVNPKVMTMLESQEKRETSLKQMLATVQRDKTKIEDTIVTLDNYKYETLERTYTKVNGDFGAIFGDLLPGNDAKLQLLEGQNITGGLEVKVCLGGVWKSSLTELSGGQRSLIALALILSLLQFKPAPMYILDEVDAALDLSHTQNIGQLLRTRFKGSQFIVVSLKEGMFNNANVLFKARFREGISIVEVSYCYCYYCCRCRFLSLRCFYLLRCGLKHTSKGKDHEADIYITHIKRTAQNQSRGSKGSSSTSSRRVEAGKENEAPSSSSTASHAGAKRIKL